MTTYIKAIPTAIVADDDELGRLLLAEAATAAGLISQSFDNGKDALEAALESPAAIVLLEGQPTVFVYEQGAYEARQVEPGERIGGRTVLKSGVKAGDQVVTSGAYALKARKLKSQLGHGH